MSNKNVLRGLLALSMCLVVTAATAQNKGKVTTLDPPESSKIQRADDIDFVPLRIGETVTEGDKIQTGLNARVGITFEDGSVIKLRPNTIMTVKKLETVRETGAQKTQLRLFLGTMKSNVEHLKNMESTFEIHTPTAVAGVRGTSFVTQVDEERNTNLFVENGSVYLESTMTGQGSLVSGNQAAGVTANGELSQAKSISGNESAIFSDETSSDQETSSESSSSGDENPDLSQNDLDAPDVDISQTDLAELTNDPRFFISLITEPGVEVNINGMIFNTEDGAVNYDYNLVEGPNEVTISVKDAAGNETVRVITKTLDTLQPILVITNYQVQENGSLLVEGQSEPGATVEANGYPLEVRSDGTFYDEIEWTSGNNEVTIEATDAAGNQTLDRRSIEGNIDSDAPQLVSASISPPQANAGQSVSILVELSDQSGISSSANYTLTGPGGTNIQGTLLASGSSLTGVANIPSNAEGGDYRLSLSYADAVGNGGSASQSGLLNVTAVDNSTPAAPSGLTATPVDANGKTTLTWTAPTSNTDNTTLTDLAGYELSLNGVLVNPYIPAGTTSYSQSGLSQTGTYRFELKAFDNASPPHKSRAATASSQ